MFARSTLAALSLALVAAAHPALADSTCADAPVGVVTWSHDGSGVLAAFARVGDSDGDGAPDVDGTYTGFAILP